jgi:hypothetical protein
MYAVFSMSTYDRPYRSSPLLQLVVPSPLICTTYTHTPFQPGSTQYPSLHLLLSQHPTATALVPTIAPFLPSLSFIYCLLLPDWTFYFFLPSLVPHSFPPTASSPDSLTPCYFVYQLSFHLSFTRSPPPPHSYFSYPTSLLHCAQGAQSRTSRTVSLIHYPPSLSAYFHFFQVFHLFTSSLVSSLLLSRSTNTSHVISTSCIAFHSRIPHIYPSSPYLFFSL